MAIESTDQLKEYCYRQLGKPVINIEVADEQANDRIDDALQMFTQRHYEGVSEIYRTYTITARDVAKGYLTVPEGIVAIVDMIDPNSGVNSGSSLEEFERLNFRLAQNDVFRLLTGGGGSGLNVTSYILTMQNIDFMLGILSPDRNFYFNAMTRQLRTSGALIEGNFIVLHTYEAVDPETYTNVYDNEWVKKYCTQLIKRQWGSNLKKLGNVQLPGGVELQGQQIYDEANEEIIRLEEQFSLRYELPVDFFTGPSYL